MQPASLRRAPGSLITHTAGVRDINLDYRKVNFGRRGANWKGKLETKVKIFTAKAINGATPAGRFKRRIERAISTGHCGSAITFNFLWHQSSRRKFLVKQSRKMLGARRVAGCRSRPRAFHTGNAEWPVFRSWRTCLGAVQLRFLSNQPNAHTLTIQHVQRALLTFQLVLFFLQKVRNF